METITVKLKESQARLIQQGSLWLDKTSKAGSTFADKTRSAGLNFIEQTKKAGTQFVTSSRSASSQLVGGVRQEASLLGEVLGVSRIEAELPRLPKAESVVSAERTLERRVLGAFKDAIDELRGRVASRITWLEQQGLSLPASTEPVAKPAAKAPSAKATPAVKANGVVKGAKKAPAEPSVPLTGYDDLSAKDVVARLDRVTEEKAEAILAYENATKKRQTVIRAAEARLAAE